MNRLRIALLALLPLVGLPLVTAGSATAGPVLTHGVTFADAAGPMVPWPEYTAGVDRYALPTTADTAGAVTVTPTTDDPTGTIEVNGQPVSSGSSMELTGLVPGDEISVIFHEGAVTTAQSWFYLPVGFPELRSSGSASDTPVFLTLASFTGLPYETIVDRNGVPLYAAQTRSGDFKVAAHDPTHYSIARTTPSSPAPPLPAEYEIVELDERLRPIRSVQLDGTPEATDFHDAQFLPDGGALLMGYRGSTHADGKPYTDAVIQVVDASGHATFSWDSKEEGNIDPSDAYVDLPSTYGDYAHINSLQMLDNGDVLASFRNTSQVMRIATTAHDGFQPGDVVWRFGGKRSDFTIVGDPDNGFCAQHDARILPNGHLTLFDNGSRQDVSGPIAAQTAPMCPDPVDPVNGALERPQTRVVEYALDETGHVATYVGETSVPGRYAPFAGNGQRLDNGNTFVGWSQSEPSDAPLASEFDDSNTELWALFGPSSGARYFSYRAFTYPAPDKIRPAVTGPLNGSVFHEGETVTASYTCTDRGGSTLHSCTGSTAAGQPLDTSPGRHTLTVTATDGAGNARTRRFTYSVTPTWQADGWVREGGRTWKGDDVYGPTTGQTVTLRVRRSGGRATANLALQNDGSATDRLRVSGTAGTAAIRVAYFQGATNVTRAVTRGTYRTASLGAGAKVVLKVVLTRTARATKGDRLRAGVAIRSVGNPSRVDHVAVVLRAT